MPSAHRSVTLAFLLALEGCGTAAPPPERPAFASLLHEHKFKPHDDYTGADTPEDLQPLQNAVNSAIKDVSAMPDPLTREVVRSRLAKLIDDTDLFATEDRDEVGRYAVRIWHAAGFQGESRLFAVSDERVLNHP